jgi:tRNA threonylcarbamoyladenosine biosynthesis protein TsaE
MTRSLELVTHSVQETHRLGRILGEQGQKGDVLLLTGELGTGKTTMTQGIAWGLGVNEYARSPTFVLVVPYQGRVPLYHIDMYRVGCVAEALELGMDEYLFGNGVCVVEWANNVEPLFPSENLSVHLETEDEQVRRILLEGHGMRYEALVETVTLALRKGSE